MEKTYKIYCLTEPDGEIRYIGQTRQTLSKRLWGHINKNKDSDTHKRRWLNKLEREGLKPNIKLIEECHSLKELNEREIFYIKKYRDDGYDLVNTSDGGTGGNHWENKTKEEQDIIRKKLSKVLKGKNKGKKRTEEEKENIRRKLTGRKNPEHSKRMKGKYGKKVKQLDLNGNLIKTWKTMRELSDNGYTQYRINKSIKNKTEYKGYLWEELIKGS